MQNKMLADKYPICVFEIPKNATDCRDAAEVAAALRERVAADPGAAEIGLFDHLAHTRAQGGEVAPEILAAMNLVFCFGPKLPAPEMLAVRPRSFGIAELADRFVISFLEAPMPQAQQKMQQWVEDLKRNA